MVKVNVHGHWTRVTRQFLVLDRNFRNQSERAESAAPICLHLRFRFKSSISLRRQVETEQGELLQRRMGGKYFNFTYKAYLRQNGSVEVDRKRHQSLIKHHLLRLKWVACWSLRLARIWRALKFHVLKFESRSGLISTWCKSEAWNLSGGSFVREINVFDAMLSGSRLGDSSYRRIFVKCWFL